MKISSPSSVELHFDRGTLLLHGVHSRAGWTFDARVGRLRTHAIHYREVKADLSREFQSRLVDLVRIPPRVF